MSLIQRIWLIILLVLALAFGSSLVISYTALRNHVEHTLRLKNTDSANTLALTITQMDKDPALLKALVSAQFNTGHYKLISLVSNDGSISIVHESNKPIAGVPDWFVSWVDLGVPPATASIENGWRRFGTLKVQSHYQFAYQTLWRSTRSLFISFVAVTLLSLLLGYMLVRSIRRPLAAMVTQARQIGNGRFSKVKEPGIRELRDVVASMNQLSQSVYEMLAEESGKLEQLQARIGFDEVTGLYNRKYFQNHLDGLLYRHDALANGVIAIVRVPDLAELNKRLGYGETNALLKSVSRQVQAVAQSRANSITGRLNGSDFALVVPGEQRTDALARAVSKALDQIRGTAAEAPPLPASLTAYGPEDTKSALLATLDTALAKAENRGDGQIEIVTNAAAPRLFQSREKMHAALTHALETNALRFDRYPVVTADNTVLHEECPSRLYLADEWRSAAMFIPWVTRFEMTATFDLQVIDAALDEIRRRATTPIAINLSAQTLTKTSFVEAVVSRLAVRAASDKLLLEWPAAGALANREAFEALGNQLTSLGYRIGLKHVGHELAQIAELHHLGLSRVKLDAALIRDIDRQTEQQGYIRGHCTLLHSININVIAEGVQTQQEMDTLAELGIDGFTGPGVV